MQDDFVVEQGRKVDSGGSHVRIGKRVCDAGPLKTFSGRDPITGNSLASQPTLSRFENVARTRDLLG